MQKTCHYSLGGGGGWFRSSLISEIHLLVQYTSLYQYTKIATTDSSYTVPLPSNSPIQPQNLVKTIHTETASPPSTVYSSPDAAYRTEIFRFTFRAARGVNCQLDRTTPPEISRELV
jgi:hypothetical protein